MNTPEKHSLIELRSVDKFYPMAGLDVHALRRLDLDISRGQMTAVIGPSGSGKSTLMNILGCMDQPSRGSYRLDGLPIGSLSNEELAHIRRRKLGFVFQKYNLLPRSTALYNVELPLFYSGCSPSQARKKAMAALDRVGLKAHARHQPNQMSGGQQQRVAIARALINDPVVLLADEPTGALDTVNSHDIMKLFQDMNRERGITVIVITHEMDVANYCQRQVMMRDGRIVSDSFKSADMRPGER